MEMNPNKALLLKALVDSTPKVESWIDLLVGFPAVTADGTSTENHRDLLELEFDGCICGRRIGDDVRFWITAMGRQMLAEYSNETPNVQSAQTSS